MHMWDSVSDQPHSAGRRSSVASSAPNSHPRLIIYYYLFLFFFRLNSTFRIDDDENTMTDCFCSQREPETKKILHFLNNIYDNNKLRTVYNWNFLGGTRLSRSLPTATFHATKRRVVCYGDFNHSWHRTILSEKKKMPRPSCSFSPFGKITEHF